MRALYSILVSFMIIGIAHGQWIQLGSDIDGEAAGDNSGEAIAISASGLVLAVGATNNDGNASNAGHVRLFEYAGGNWVQMGYDIDGNTFVDNLGKSVALSDDGHIVAVGAPYTDVNGNYSGEVKVFHYTGSFWLQMGSTILGDAAYDHFGHSVSLSADGITLAIGAPNNDGISGGTSPGQIKIYSFTGSDWVLKGDPIYGEADYDRWGSALSLSDNGNILAGTAIYNNGAGNDAGHARLFEYIGGDWLQIGSDINGDAAQDNLGISVSLSANGEIVSVGAPFHGAGTSFAGRTKVFQNMGGNWVPLGNILDGMNIGDRFGWSVSLSDDGSILAIGALTHDGLDTVQSNRGQVAMYQFGSGIWNQIGNDIYGEAPQDYFGYSVSSNSNASIVAVGGSNNDGNGINAGHARVYANCSMTYDTLFLSPVACGSYTSPSGQIWTSSGVYMDTVQVAAACEMIAIIDLTVNQNTATMTVIDTATCADYVSPSGRYVWNRTGTYMDVIPNAIGCDSVLLINLVSNTVSTIDTLVCGTYTSPSGNYDWSYAGLYADTIPNAVGCDSILMINLQSTTTAGFEVVACDSIQYTSPSGNHIWTSDGVYQDTILNASGCDSILTIDLAFAIDTSVSLGFYELISNDANALYQWLYCDSAYAPVVGAIDQNFWPFYDGNYAVVVSQGTCTDTSACYFQLAFNSIEEFSSEEVHVYPNPTTGKVNILAHDMEQVEIWDMQGNIIYTGIENELDLSEESRGLYVIEITTDKYTFIRKLVKQ